MSASVAEEQERVHSSISPIELIAIIGYALATAWMILCFFWLFCEFPPDASVQSRDFAQMWIFIGIALSHLLVYLLGRRPSFSLFYRPFVALMAVGASCLPIICILAYQSPAIPYAALCVSGFIAGLSFGAVNVAWLDVASRMKTREFGRFAGLAFLIAGVIFVLSTFLPPEIQPAFCMAFAFLSIGLLLYASANAEGNEQRAPEESTKDSWFFAKEIEPSLFMFGVVFSLSFVFVFNFGRDYVFIGLASIIPGALAAVVVAMLHKEPNITIVQRALVVLMVITCIVTPFAGPEIQLACACVMIASWAFFICTNYAFILKKVVKEQSAPLFRQAPIRLLFNASGFALGWVITACATVIFGPHAGVFANIRLACVVILVIVVMVFIPESEHHSVSGEAVMPQQADTATDTPTHTAELDAQKVYEMKCDKVSQLFQLSPREQDVLRYLGKGRNVAYIQEKLVVSPHTVKTHIYNIYRKTDIHSQQKLMDLIEEIELN